MLKRCKIIMMGILAAMGMLAMATFLTGQAVLYENRTDSAPRGVYVRYPGDKLEYGDYVIVSLDRKVGRLPEGFLLLKQVKGFPGDLYKVTEDGLEIRGRVYPLRDIAGLPKPEKGRYVLAAGQYPLMNESRDSFDSRYLGPANEKDIRSKVKMIFSYEPVVDVLDWISS